MLDPTNRNTVYAGTTEGLYKTLDGGTTWKRMTGPDVIVNDVFVDPKNPQHVLLATDRSGVLESEDAATTFKASNTGFSQRQVASLLIDAKTPQTILAGVVNDKIYGGVFVSHDDGATWIQQSNGLQGRDVFDMSQSADGVILAGTNAGIFRWDGTNWQPDGKIVKPEKKTSYVVHKGKRSKVETTVMVPGGQIDVRVSDVDAYGSTWYAATANGVYASADQGATWVGGPVLDKTEYRAVASSGSMVIAAQRTALAWSRTAERIGSRWPCRISSPGCNPSPWPAMGASGWGAVRASSTVRIAVRIGPSSPPYRFPTSADLVYDPELKRVVITSWASSWVLAVDPADRTWKFYDPGWKVRHVRSMNGRLVAATLYNGVVVEPQKTMTKVAVAQTH